MIIPVAKATNAYFSKTSGWQRMLERIVEASTGPNAVKVGFPRGTDDNIMLRAVVNEFGAVIPVTDAMRGFFWGRGAHISQDVIVIPERPFMRNAIATNLSKWESQLSAGAVAIMKGVSTAEIVLEMVGLGAVADIQRSIDDMNDPPNAPLTVKWKGSSKPLVDTGQMRAAVTYIVTFSPESEPLTAAG
jgi:hypothetical protein